MKKRVKNSTARKSGAKKARRSTQAKGPRKAPPSKSKKSVAQRPKRTRSASRRSTAKTASYRSRKIRPIRIQPGRHEKVKYVRHITKFTTTRGRKQKLTPRGISKVKRLVKSARGKRVKGRRFTEQVSVKIRYKGRDGRMKSRWENYTSQKPSEIQEFLDSLDQGVMYTQYDPNTGDVMKVHSLKDRGTIQEVTYEKIVELPNE